MADHKETSNIGYNQPTTSMSSTPKKRHRRMTDSDVPSTLSSASSSSMMNSEPISTSSSNTSASALTSLSTCTSPTLTPRVAAPRFPVRIGITWKKGEKLEAKDFSRTWYPSKIVEIDEAAKYVLIHFEGWNQRYDEWVPMDSEKLRPVTRHSERKDKGVKKRRIHPHPIYRAGEQVLAKWTDCKKYPAKISRLKEDGMYEVIFYDGVTRLIQPMNIQPIPESMKDLRTLPPASLLPPRTKPSLKQAKVTLPECVKRAKEKFEKKMLFGECTVHLDKNKMADKSPDLHEKSKVSSGSIVPETKNKLPGQSRRSAKSKILQRRRFHSNKAGHTSRKSILRPSLDRGQRVGSSRISARRQYSWRIRKLKNLSPESSQSETTKPSLPGLTEELELTSKVTDLPAITNSASASTTAARKSVAVQETVGSGLPQVEVMPSTIKQTDAQEPIDSHPEELTFGPTRTKKRSNTVPHFHPKRRKVRSKSKDVGARSNSLAKRPPMLGQVDRAKSLDLGLNIASPQIFLPMPVFVPSKAFIVEEDHNPFKCHHQGCNKDFRKESLLAYHIKYYHTEVEMTPQAGTAASSSGCDRAAGVSSPLMPPAYMQSSIGTPITRKRRKKTSSICSTDSDVSISSRGRGSGKRQHHDSEVSITAATSPDILNRDLWADGKPSLDSVNEEFVAVDTEDEEMEADVVNCICGQRETNGLMIQCDLCMCWQHFACADTSNSGVPPINYVCLVCEKTPGIRDSCRYMYDMGWERQGELPSFPFVTESSSEHLRPVACECNDMTSVLLAIKSALHSTRRQIKISKEDADSEFQLWQTDWDNWTKAEEDLTLTPRSGDPDPSPTPSTFLFPQAPCSNTVTSTAEASSPAVAIPSEHTSVPPVRAAMSTASSSQISHFTTSLTTVPTLEVAPVVTSLPLLPQTAKLSHLTEALTSSTITSTSGIFQVGTISPASSNHVLLMPPQTTSAGHNSSLTSIQGQAKVPFSDNPTDSFQTLSSSEYLSSQTQSSAHKTDNGHLSLVDEKLTESDCGGSNKLPLVSGSRQFISASATSQLQKISSVISQSQGIPSVTSQSQGIPSVTSQSQGIPSVTSQSQGIPSVALQSQGISSVTLQCQGIPSVTSQYQGILSVTSQSQGISSVTSQSRGMLSVTSQSQGIPSVTSQSQGISSVTSQSQGISSVTSQSQGISSVTSQSKGILLVTSQSQEILSVTSLSQGISLVASQSQGIPSVTSQSQGISLVTSQSQGIPYVTSQSQAISSATLSDSSAFYNGVGPQAKLNAEDVHINRESAVTSSGRGTSEQAAERQVQTSSNGHENNIGKKPLITGTGVNDGDTDGHMTSLYVEVNGSQGLQVGCHDDDDDDDAPDNDTDTAEESLDPYRNCEHNLLVHVSRVHADIEKQLEALEQQLTELENSEHNNPTVQLSEDNILNDVPALKKSLSKLHRNLVKVQRFCVHH